MATPFIDEISTYFLIRNVSIPGNEIKASIIIIKLSSTE